MRNRWVNWPALDHVGVPSDDLFRPAQFFRNFVVAQRGNDARYRETLVAVRLSCTSWERSQAGRNQPHELTARPARSPILKKEHPTARICEMQCSLYPTLQTVGTSCKCHTQPHVGQPTTDMCKLGVRWDLRGGAELNHQEGPG